MNFAGILTLRVGVPKQAAQLSHIINLFGFKFFGLREDLKEKN